eukprot:g21874.t1
MHDTSYDLTDAGWLNRRSFLVRSGWLAGAAVWSSRARGAVLQNPKFSAYPFSLGVASGDPLPDGVVLWTRLAPKPLTGGGMPDQPVAVAWEVAEDQAFAKVVRKGSIDATPDWGHSVHVEVDGLKPDRWYWYRFKAGTEISPIGRTRTSPPRDARPESMKFAFASCQHFESGLFTAYEHMLNENVDLVCHLGDYIYEYAGVDRRVRKHAGPETTTLFGYRQRLAQYKTDKALQNMHAACPWLMTWDDHEFDNNCANDISEERGITPFNFLKRRAQAYKAYYEHMPLRRTALPKGPHMKLYRKVPFGRLAEFYVLDTRQYRTDQPCGDGNKVPCKEVYDPKATLLGETQEKWLTSGLMKSNGRWNILAQQVMMARVGFRSGNAFASSMDQWPGYEVNRRRLLKFFHDRKISNPVVLTGDIHSNWANNLIADFDKLESKTVFRNIAAEPIEDRLMPACAAAVPALMADVSPSDPPALATDSRLKIRLYVMMFLQYFVQGSYLPVISVYLEKSLKFNAEQLGNFGSALAIGPLIAPFIIGQIIDRHFSTQYVLAACHFLGGILMLLMFAIAREFLFPGIDRYWPILILGVLYSALYIPSLMLTNSLTFHHLADRDREFPLVRLWGTIGFIVPAWLIEGYFLAGLKGAKLNLASSIILALAGVSGLVMAGYSMSLPDTPPPSKDKADIAPRKVLGLLSMRNFLVLVLISLVVSAVHKFYFVWNSPFVKAILERGGTFTAQVQRISSIGQIAEVVVMAMLGFWIKRFGFKMTMLAGTAAYMLRCLIFAGAAMLDASSSVALPLVCLGQALHGFCFGCFIAAAYIYTDRVAPKDVRGTMQNFYGTFVLGVGAIAGGYISGQIGASYTTTIPASAVEAEVSAAENAGVIVTLDDSKETATVRNWTGIWLSGALLAGIAMLGFLLLFPKVDPSVLEELDAQPEPLPEESTGGSFTGFPSKVYTHGWILGLWIGSYVVVPICAMGLLGKRINQVARISGAITVPDVLRDRFRSPKFGLIAVCLIVFFMSFNLVAQFKAGSLILKTLLEGVKVFENTAVELQSMTVGIDFLKGVDPQYLLCLLTFGVAVVLYTTYGGFHAVVWTDVMQGVVMVIGVLIMLPLAIYEVGGLDSATREMAGMTTPRKGIVTVDVDRPAIENDMTISAGTWLRYNAEGQERPRIFRVSKLAVVQNGESHAHAVPVVEITTPQEIDRILNDDSKFEIARNLTVRDPFHRTDYYGTVTLAASSVAEDNRYIPTGTWFVVDGSGDQPKRYLRLAKHTTIQGGEKSVVNVAVTEPREKSRVAKAQAEYEKQKSIEGVTATNLKMNSCEYASGANQPGVYVTGPGPDPKKSYGFLPLSLAISFFFMWAISGAGQPSSMVRLMAFNSSQTLRRSIFTVAMYYSMIYFPLVIIFCCARILMPGMDSESDRIMPAMAVFLTENVGLGWLAGLLVAAPFAAVMSTVDSFLLMISSALVRDIYQRNINPDVQERTIKRLSYLFTLLVGTAAMLGAVNPPQFLQDIIVYTGSGLAACFLAPVVFGLYWPRANAHGCIAGMLAGFGAHLSMYITGMFVNNSFFTPYRLFDFDPIIVGLFVSFAATYFATRVTPPPERDLVVKYFAKQKS